MFRNKNTGFLSPTLLFWIFSSFPRLWYFALSNTFSADTEASVLPVLFVGFIRDGVLIGIFLFLIALFSKKIFLLSQPQKFMAVVIQSAIYCGLLSLVAMNIEFLSVFGSNANWDHIRLLWQGMDGPMLFLEDPTRVARLVIEIVLAPLLLFFCCLKFQWPRLNKLIYRRSLMIGVSVCLVLLGWLAPLKLDDPLRASLSENALFKLFQNVIVVNELKPYDEKIMMSILETSPLPKPVIKTPPWIYPDPNFPLVKATAYDLCRLDLLSGMACDKDEDGDGYPVKEDCNDLEKGINPKAKDIPGNGLDEDCSGLDANPPNVIYIHWEGARAVNVGSLGYSVPATPRFDAIVKKNGVSFRNAYSNATQTRWSLTSIYCSVFDRLSTKWIFKDDTDLNLLSVPFILRKKGYDTFYIHGGDNNFGNLSNRLWEWFETIYDNTGPPINKMEKFHWGLKDRDLFNFCYKLIKERKSSKPFYMAIATLSLHEPYALPDSSYEMADHKQVENQIPNIMRYSDAALGDFLERILADPDLKNTVFIVSADHGLNRYAPHKTAIQNMMWEDLVWVPLALIGPEWNMKPGTNDEVRQLADIGPTILDRLGIELPNPFVGQSLLRRFGSRTPRVFFANSNGGLWAGMRENGYKYWVEFNTKAEYLFDLASDRKELNNLAGNSKYEAAMNKYYEDVKSVFTENNQLIRENRIWDWKYWPKKN
jgi:arylsulfatase A-like enzyme